MGSITGLGSSPGEGNGNPFQYSCLENSMDRGAWWAIVLGVLKSQTWLKRLSTHAFLKCNSSKSLWLVAPNMFIDGNSLFSPTRGKILWILVNLKVFMNPPAKEVFEFNIWMGKIPLGKGIATHSSILAWRIPWTEKPGGLQSTGSQRVRHNWSNLVYTHTRSFQFRWIQRFCKFF